MAVAVVHGLELVEVDEQGCSDCFASSGAVNGRLDPDDGGRSVRDTRERVVRCFVSKVRLELVALDDGTGEHLDRACQRPAQTAGQWRTQDRVTEGTLGQRGGFGFEQLQDRHDVGECVGQDSRLARRAVAAP